MTTVSGEIKIVTDVAAPISQVWVSAPKMRADDGAVIAAFHDRFNVREGRVSFNCRPGPARVTLVSAGQPMDSLDILVPAEGAISLWKAARNFQIAGEESPETLMQYLDEIRRVGASVKADISGAKQSVSQAEGHANAARGHRDAAQRHANTAQGHATTAQEHASDASGHASAAASSESEAGKAAVRAEGARSEARDNWDNARAAQTGAEQARDDAQGHATTAQGHADTASTQATKSENAANRLWDSVAWNGDRLSVAGRQSESLKGPRGDRGPAGSLEGLEPETIVRAGADGVRMGKHFTLEHDGSSNHSTSLFLKNGASEYEFFTNAAGKFGAWDKRHSRGLFQADRNVFDHQTAVNMGNNQLRGLPRPTGNDHAATKKYVDGAVENVNVDTSGLVPQSDVGSAESTEGNKLVRRKGDGAIVVPTTGTERRVAISRGEVDDKLAGKAASDHTHTMEKISDLRPDTLIRSGSEPELGRTATITASGGTYYAILKQVNGSHTLEQYWTPSGDYGIYSGGSNRIVAKANVFEHHTATDMRGNELRGLRAPTADNHAATKAYVDALVRNVDTNRMQLVDSLPSNPDSQTLYLIAE
nr:MAG TPA: hyaluronase tail fiber protein [Caudoviricetes sp.]